jgi:hypothetical protein
VLALLARFNLTAGHNALHGSGPVKTMRSTMRWAEWVVLIAAIDRFGITCCSPPNHHPTRSLSHREHDGIFVALTSCHYCPRHPGNIVGERDGSDFVGRGASKVVK